MARLPDICKTCEKFKQRTTIRGCPAYESTVDAQRGTATGQCLGYTTNADWQAELDAQVEEYTMRKEEGHIQEDHS